jgi:TolB protein
MDRNGSNIRRISSSGSYAEPTWSINDYIAFTKVSRDFGFTIGVMKYSPTSTYSNERLIASGYLVESPSWAPNGRVILFTKGSKPSAHKTSGLSRLHTIDFTGYNERVLPTPYDASDPDWSKPRS